jgi:hypothetical protein
MSIDDLIDISKLRGELLKLSTANAPKTEICSQQDEAPYTKVRNS